MASRDWLRQLVAPQSHRSAAVSYRRILHRASQVHRGRHSRRLSERSDPWLCLRLQQTVAGAGRFSERERKLNRLRVYLEHHARLPDEPGALCHERFAAQGAGLRRLYLHLPSLEERVSEERSHCAWWLAEAAPPTPNCIALDHADRRALASRQEFPGESPTCAYLFSSSRSSPRRRLFARRTPLRLLSWRKRRRLRKKVRARARVPNRSRLPPRRLNLLQKQP